MKMILIIGAGFGQLPAILRAKELEYEVITIDKNPNALGMKYADFSYEVDVIDYENALKIAKKHKVNGVFTMQTDLPIPTVGYINDALGLKGACLTAANRCSNKIECREAFKQFGVPQPKFFKVETYDQAKDAANKLAYPCIIKAPDSSGSRGVSKVNSKYDINDAVDEAFKYSRKKEILVEEYIEGLEIGAQGFSINGKCISVLVHNDIVALPPYMVPIGHSFPVKLPLRDEEKVKKAVAAAVEALGITDGPSNIDLILDKDNNPKIIEIGARIGATCLPELVKYHTGIDWVEQSIKSCLNEEVNLESIKSTPVTAYIIQSDKDGILKSFIIPDEVMNHPKVKEVEITAKIGDKVNVLRKGTDRIGKIVVEGDSVEEADKLALELMSIIYLEIE